MELSKSIAIEDVQNILGGVSQFSDEIVRISITKECLTLNVLDFHDRSKTIGSIQFLTRDKAIVSTSLHRYCFTKDGLFSGSLEPSDCKEDLEEMVFELGQVFLGYGEIVVQGYDTHKSLKKNTDTYLLSISTCRKIEIYK